MSQVVITVGYWATLYVVNGVKDVNLYFKFYEHIIPFSIMAVDFLFTLGEYTTHGRVAATLLWLVYCIVNVLVYLTTAFVVYNTDLSHPGYWPCYVVILVTVGIVYLLGTLLMKVKSIVNQKLKEYMRNEYGVLIENDTAHNSEQETTHENQNKEKREA